MLIAKEMGYLVVKVQALHYYTKLLASTRLELKFVHETQLKIRAKFGAKIKATFKIKLKFTAEL